MLGPPLLDQSRSRLARREPCLFDTFRAPLNESLNGMSSHSSTMQECANDAAPTQFMDHDVDPATRMVSDLRHCKRCVHREARLQVPCCLWQLCWPSARWRRRLVQQCSGQGSDECVGPNAEVDLAKLASNLGSESVACSSDEECMFKVRHRHHTMTWHRCLRGHPLARPLIAPPAV